jgi:cytochrome c oxidase subunit 3
VLFFSPFLPLSSRFWPFVLGLSLLSLPLTFLIWISLKVSICSLLLPLFLVCVLSFIWWRDVVREGLNGFHSSKLELSFRWGIMLFITSEVFFFLRFFWAFYDSSLSPRQDIGIVWPPKGILPLAVYSVPLLNTVILLSSGVSVTWAHHSLTNNLFSNTFYSLVLTIILGVYFLFMQYEEYRESAFSISDGVYGSTFFVSTGFHGIHVIVGTSILIFTLLQLLWCNITFLHHFVFEASAWYWHFVDVVWLFLYISIYWWGTL